MSFVLTLLQRVQTWVDRSRPHADGCRLHLRGRRCAIVLHAYSSTVSDLILVALPTTPCVMHCTYRYRCIDGRSAKIQYVLLAFESPFRVVIHDTPRHNSQCRTNIPSDWCVTCTQGREVPRNLLWVVFLTSCSLCCGRPLALLSSFPEARLTSISLAAAPPTVMPVAYSHTQLQWFPGDS
jgi:hypothetical protein